MFTELIQNIGVEGVQVEELMVLDDEELERVKYVFKVSLTKFC